MVGTMGDVSLADAIVKEIPGFDKQLAYEAIRKDAFEIPPKFVEGVGRACLESYLQYGYIPHGSSTTTGLLCVGLSIHCRVSLYFRRRFRKKNISNYNYLLLRVYIFIF